MFDLSFQVKKAEVLPHAAAPCMNFKLAISSASEKHSIRGMSVQCQIRIEPTRRRYTVDEQAHLRELFGAPERWSQTLRSVLWTHATVSVPAFSGSIEVDLPVPCTSDFAFGAAKYFYGLDEGTVPLILLFSGSVFYSSLEGMPGMQISPIPWDKETSFQLPVNLWKEMMAAYYPNSSFLSLQKDVFDRLYEYRTRNGLTSWESTLDSLLQPGRNA